MIGERILFSFVALFDSLCSKVFIFWKDLQLSPQIFKYNLNGFFNKSGEKTQWNLSSTEEANLADSPPTFFDFDNTLVVIEPSLAAFFTIFVDCFKTIRKRQSTVVRAVWGGTRKDGRDCH